MRGIAGTCPAVLPSTHIGSTANEMTGPKVIRDPRWRKQIQGVMNRQQSTSILGKDEPENHGIAFTRYLSAYAPARGRLVASAFAAPALGARPSARGRGGMVDAR